jgi:hypothetical protein
MAYNVPDDWNSYYENCSICGSRFHASEGGCGCTEDKVECRVCDEWVEEDEAREHEADGRRYSLTDDSYKTIRETVHTCHACLECEHCGSTEALRWDDLRDDCWYCAKCRLEWDTEDVAEALEEDAEIAAARVW